jgi:meso-butanediol dehydrogenase/(S,S)-butanediol dehydrogenase/diacetyl reductase
MTSLDSKVALITGAASGIGLATSQLLQEEGATLIGVDMAFDQTNLKNSESKSITLKCDLRIPSEVENLFEKVSQRFPHLNCIVNSAGIEMRGNVVDVTVEQYERVMDTNVKSTFLVCKYGIPLLLKSVVSSIINLSSDLGLQPIPGVDTYAASKGAIIALTKTMSKNWAKSGLRINCVAPGPIDTPLLRRFQDQKTLDFVKEVMLPQGRFGSAQGVARVIAFLASDDASLINGAIVTANGGLVG